MNQPTAPWLAPPRARGWLGMGVVALMCLVWTAVAEASFLGEPDPEVWVTDGAVNALARDGSTIYIGGDFTLAGETSRRYLAAIDADSGVILPWTPNVIGPVFKLAADESLIYAVTTGSGHNLYLVSAFRFDEGGDPLWQLGVNRAVHAIIAGGNMLYLGGEFTAVGGTSRSRLAALDTSTGTVDDWAPSLNFTVRTLAYYSGILYVGGNFNSVSGTTRNRLASFAFPGGELTEWDPDANSVVTSLMVSNGQLYASGSFTEVGATKVAHFAMLDPVTGAVGNFRTQATSAATVMVAGDTAVFMGGGFRVLGTYHAPHFLGFDANTAEVLPNLPAFNGDVVAIEPDGMGGWFVGGSFTMAGEMPVARLARLLPDLSVDPDWKPEVASGTVRTLKLSGSTLFIGGFFDEVENTPRRNVAALDASAAALLEWNPGVSGGVGSMTVHNGRVYVAGSIREVGGAERRGAASIDADTGLVTAWNPSLMDAYQVLIPCYGLPGFNCGSYWVYSPGTSSAIFAQGDNVLVGGPFNASVLVQTPYGTFHSGDPYLMTFDTEWGSPRPWSLGANASVGVLHPHGDTLYLGGRFTSIMGADRHRLAAFNLGDGALSNWAPFADDSIVDIKTGNNLLYALGGFLNIDNTHRTGLAAIDLESGEVSPWNPCVITLFPQTVAAGHGYVLLGANRIGLNSLNASRLGAVDAATGMPRPWTPALDDTPSDNVVTDSALWVAGAFTTVNGQPRRGIARFSRVTPPTVHIASPPSPTRVRVYRDVAVTFSQPVSGLQLEHFETSGATLSNLRGSGAQYWVDVALDPVSNLTAPWETGTQKWLNEVYGPRNIRSFRLPAGVVENSHGVGNMASNVVTIVLGPSLPDSSQWMVW